MRNEFENVIDIIESEFDEPETKELDFANQYYKDQIFIHFDEMDFMRRNNISQHDFYMEY